MTGLSPEALPSHSTDPAFVGVLARWQWLIRVIVIGIPVDDAIPTAINLYYSFKHGIPYAQVSHKLEQYDLWVRNMDCAVEYKELSANPNTKINIGVCAANGDISIKVARSEGRAIIEWIAFDRFKQVNAFFNLLVSPAYADDVVTAAPPSGMRVTQAGAQVLCQG